MGRWLEIQTAWKKNTVPKSKLVSYFINGIPNMTYPSGESEYNQSLKRHGQESMLSLANWWREIFHLVVGAAAGLVAPFAWLVVVLFTAKESYELYTRLRDQKDLGLIKMSLDIAFYGLGGFITSHWNIWALTGIL